MAKKNKKKAFMKLAELYNEDTLEMWQRMVNALGIDGYYGSKTQCKKAIKTVFVNIRDFLEAVVRNEPVPQHGNYRALMTYTRENRRFFARRDVKSGGPLSALLRVLM
ncbi:hypothetical protein SEPCBS57363_001496 [Sporothrix epigloea]|uniref:Uncharacterized protein n=1 Tax=Sporothrix epigloea TaxID=1892477 RepID=A0ABP0DAU0_9PEZI